MTQIVIFIFSSWSHITRAYDQESSRLSKRCHRRWWWWWWWESTVCFYFILFFFLYWSQMGRELRLRHLLGDLQKILQTCITHKFSHICIHMCGCKKNALGNFYFCILLVLTYVRTYDTYVQVCSGDCCHLARWWWCFLGDGDDVDDDDISCTECNSASSVVIFGMGILYLRKCVILVKIF